MAKVPRPTLGQPSAFLQWVEQTDSGGLSPTQLAFAAARKGEPYWVKNHFCNETKCYTYPAAVSLNRALQIVQSWEQQRLRMAELNTSIERALGWDLAFQATHKMQRAQEAARKHQRNASAATLIHVVISILENDLPGFAHAILQRRDPRVRLVVYNKLASLNVSATTIDAHGNEQHNVPFKTQHLRNCFTYVEYVDQHYENLPDVAILTKTNFVSTTTVDFMIKTATSNMHHVDSYPWPEWQGRTLTKVRCHPRWAWSPLYRQLCPCPCQSSPCVDGPARCTTRYQGNQWDTYHGCIFNCRSKLIHQIVDWMQDDEHINRAGRPRSLVEEVFSEGIFAYSRTILRQHPHHLYKAWKHELAQRGDEGGHQECLDEWATLFDEPGDDPWGRDATTGVPVWKASPSRLLYAPIGVIA
jgi:hypothetical protein